MAITTQYSVVGTAGTGALEGLREDLTDVISIVDFDETPLISRIGRASATAILHEWQTDDYGDATTTTQLEGLTFAEDTPVVTTKLTNYCAIQKRNATVTGTAEAVSKAGRASEMAYQVVRSGVKLRRDMEATILGQAAGGTIKTSGATNSARTLGSIMTYLDTTDTTQLGANGAIGGGNGTAANTDSTTFVNIGNTTTGETALKAVLKGLYNNGGMRPGTVIMCNATMKQLISAFTGRTNARQTQSDERSILAVADLYMSDFGDVAVIPNRLQRERDILVADPNYLKVSYLRPMHTDDIAHVGDYDRKEVRVEYTLQVTNPDALGAILDCSTATS